VGRSEGRRATVGRRGAPRSTTPDEPGEQSAASPGWLTDRLGRRIPDGSWPPGREAPGELEQLRRFLNTANPETGAELLDSASGLRRWLRAERHPTPGLLGEADLGRALALRAALHTALPPAPPAAAADGAIAPLEAIVARLGVSLALRPGPHLRALDGGLDPFLVSMVSTAFTAMVDGGWARLRACRNPGCRWVFYDHSPNASGVWCSTGACGGRMKARAYRRRQREAR
jgi:predicted RNA-binding Zn ribbon-like protein